jgi:hypothetical protein
MASQALCGADDAVGTLCACEVLKLRPLQGAVGLIEVREKENALRKLSATAVEAKGHADPIKVVKGPLGVLFITDHHHEARALADLNISTSTCRIDEDFSNLNEPQFWQILEKRKLAHLEDEDGRSIEPSNLPQTVSAMGDDPFRSLAGILRKRDRAYCKQHDSPFAEFAWADFFRNSGKITAVEINDYIAQARSIGLTLAASAAASGLPGYRGTQGGRGKCKD